MKKIIPFLAAAMVVVLAGCASEKEKPLAQRGWIGGEYALSRPSTFLLAMSPSRGTVGSFPAKLLPIQKAGILITKLETNAPAAQAGLRKGDLILELNHHPVTRWGDFRRIIDQSEPGTLLAVKAYRHGQMVEYDAKVGREKFRTEGNVALVLPTVVHQWKLWPDSGGFSLVLVGYERNPGVRHDLEDNREAFDDDWRAYLGLVEVSMGKRVEEQE